MKLPGFRKGKVPAAARDPAPGARRRGRAGPARRAPEWYDAVLRESGINPVGEPKLDVEKLPGPGRGPGADDRDRGPPPGEAGRLHGPRGRQARARSARRGGPDRARPAARGVRLAAARGARGGARATWCSLDYRGTVDGEPFEGGEGRDQLVELGTGTLVDGFEEGLVGASAGEERRIEVSFPDDYRATELAGKDADLRGHGQGGAREGASRARRRLRGRRLRVRDAGRASRRDPRTHRRGLRTAGRRGVPRGGRRRGRRQRDDRGSRRHRRPPGPRSRSTASSTT